MHSSRVHLGDFLSCIWKCDLGASQLEPATLHLLLLNRLIILQLPLLRLIERTPRRGRVSLSVHAPLVPAWRLFSGFRWLSVRPIHAQFVVVIVEAGQVTWQILGRMDFLIWDHWLLLVEYLRSVHVGFLSRKIMLGRVVIFFITWNISIVFRDWKSFNNTQDAFRLLFMIQNAQEVEDFISFGLICFGKEETFNLAIT